MWEKATSPLGVAGPTLRPTRSNGPAMFNKKYVSEVSALLPLCCGRSTMQATKPQDRQFPCPDCGATVTIELGREVSAGFNTIGFKDSVRCPDCGRIFSSVEIDDLLTGGI
jgi:hypothetical protein